MKQDQAVNETPDITGLVISMSDVMGKLNTILADAIILDLRMPLTSGMQVLRSLRAIPGMQHTPVTIVTGDYYLAESQTNEIQSLGADVRFKPLWLDELVTLARDMLHTPVRD